MVAFQALLDNVTDRNWILLVEEKKTARWSSRNVLLSDGEKLLETRVVGIPLANLSQPSVDCIRNFLSLAAQDGSTQLANKVQWGSHEASKQEVELVVLSSSEYGFGDIWPALSD